MTGAKHREIGVASRRLRPTKRWLRQRGAWGERRVADVVKLAFDLERHARHFGGTLALIKRQFFGEVAMGEPTAVHLGDGGVKGVLGKLPVRSKAQRGVRSSR
ncbi:hypothetical protein JCM2811A_35850 [Methylorubrum rhodinum]